MKKDIKLKNYEIVNIVNALSETDSLLNSKEPSKRLGSFLLWDIDNNFSSLLTLAKKINEFRVNIDKIYSDNEHSYTDTDENGNSIHRVKDEFIDEYKNEVETFMNKENEVSINMISINDLNGYDLIPSDFQSIKFMINNE